MKIWITSDTHFFHKNIIKYCGRPFKNYKEMNEKLISNWNAKVAKEDLVIHLGDFSFGNKEKIMAIRKRLNGTIILIRGSHDHKIVKGMGFIIVNGNLQIGKHIFSHEPLENIPKGLVNIHGHIHQRESYLGKNVSVEKTNYGPVELNLILGEK
mgnify:CR=1 FL=1